MHNIFYPLHNKLKGGYSKSKWSDEQSNKASFTWSGYRHLNKHLPTQQNNKIHILQLPLQKHFLCQYNTARIKLANGIPLIRLRIKI